jgi:hypothetical protein
MDARNEVPPTHAARMKPFTPATTLIAPVENVCEPSANARKSHV